MTALFPTRIDPKGSLWKTADSILAISGTTPPASYTQALKTADDIKQFVNKTRSIDIRAEIGEATRAAAFDGRDPATDPEVQALVTRKTLLDIGALSGTELAAAQRVVATIRDDAALWIELMRPAYDKAVKNLQDALRFRAVQDVTAFDKYEYQRGRSEDVAAVITARDSIDLLNTLRKHWEDLASLHGVNIDNHKAMPFIDLTPQDWHKEYAPFAQSTYPKRDTIVPPFVKGDMWKLAKLGATFNMKTLKEAQKWEQEIAVVRDKYGIRHL